VQNRINDVKVKDNTFLITYIIYLFQGKGLMSTCRTYRTKINKFEM